MENTNGKEPAFPHEDVEYDGNDQYKIIRNGLTKREYFAAMLYPTAVQDCNNMPQEELERRSTGKIFWWKNSPEIYAIRSLELADALLTQLNNK